MYTLLQRDGLSIELLARLSYETKLGISLKKNLHYFDKAAVLAELLEIRRWYDAQDDLHTLALDYRIKSIQYNWLHKYLYKKEVANSVGCQLRSMYESGSISTENEFKEALDHVLCSG